MEVELKLLVAPEDLARIDRHPAVRAVRRGGAHRQRLETVYYDTPDGALARAGVALRLRHDGKRWVQTLKGGGQAAAGLHARDEIEWNVAGNAVDVALLDATPYAGLFAQGRVRARLRPVFVTEFERTTRMLAFPEGTVAELALDRGAIRAGRAVAPISEAEIELKGGDAARLFACARTLARDIPLRLGVSSKAERGHALGRAPAPPRKARAVPLEPSMTAGAALARIAMACVAQMQANEEGVRAGGDAEYLHQLRVGLRRLRACLGLVALGSSKAAVAPLAEELRWLGGALGPARDWDVFMTETFPPLARRFRQTAGLASFRARAARTRRAHGEAARAAVSSARYTDLLLALGEAFAREDLPAFATKAAPPAAAEGGTAPPPRFDAPVGAFAAFVLGERHRRVRKRGGGVPEATPEERHRVRIAAKKLRYAAEFFAALYPAKRVARYVGALEDLQDILGALNDAAVVDRLLAEVAQGGRPIAAGVDGLVRGWVAAVAQHELARFRPAWRTFADAKRFWN